MNSIRKISIRTIAASILLLATGTALADDTTTTSTQCHDVVVYHERNSHQDHVVGTVIGAVAGGLIGHQFGGGSGKVLATAGGAVAGGAIGHHVATEADRHKYRTVERVCTKQ